MSFHKKPAWITPHSTHISGAKYLYYEIGAVMNLNTGPPRTTLNKKGQPIITSAAVIPKYRRYLNPAREGKTYGRKPVVRSLQTMLTELAAKKKAILGAAS